MQYTWTHGEGVAGAHMRRIESCRYIGPRVVKFWKAHVGGKNQVGSLDSSKTSSTNEG
jgi:hypothetical protein